MKDRSQENREVPQGGMAGSAAADARTREKPAAGTRQAVFRSVARRAARRVPAGSRRLVTGFIRDYYARVPLEDLLARDPDDLAGAALAHFRFAEGWTRGPRRLRVYNPQPERDGWSSPHTIVEVVTGNSPFLVDSLTMEINRQGFINHLMIHPMLRLVRDRRGRIREVSGVAGETDGSGLVSFMHAEIDRETDPLRLRELEEGLNRILDDVQRAVRDWTGIVDRVEDIIDALESRPPPLDVALVAESKAFLRWLLDEHFIFLGYREYELVRTGGGESLRVVPGSGYGILRERRGVTRSESFEKLPSRLKRRARERTLLTLTKSNSRSTVHRSAYLDFIGVKRYDRRGRVAGECRIVGLYTSAAYMSPPRTVPLVRRKVEAVFERSGFLPRSHAGKSLLNVLDTFPRDELLQASVEELYETAMGIVDLQERQRVRVFIRRDPFERFCACLVFVPRERFHSGIRRQIQDILMRALNGTSCDFETSISESVYARLYLTVHTTPGGLPQYDIGAIEAEVAAATRTWADDLHLELAKLYGEERGNDLVQRYRDAFPAAYREDHGPADAARDIRLIEEALAAGDLRLTVYRAPGMRPDELMFKLYQPDACIHLSAAIPILEFMGLFVLTQRPYEIEPHGTRSVWLHDFGMRRQDGQAVDLAKVRDRFEEAFALIWRGHVENDRLNRLVLGAGLSAREIALLRAYMKYSRQIGTAFSQAYIEDTLNRHSQIAALLVELFRARFDPDAESGRRARVARLERQIAQRLDAVSSLDEDRILRRFFHLIRATLRTNYFRRDADGRPPESISFKLASREIPELEPPYPRFEIFVYSPRVEGVHLRGGRVARGGLRWSDRREDFRTEVLGLMKAQMVKNAVIVPVGAKGGFYVKQAPEGDRAALLGEGKACYRIFIRGLLDITDNRVAGRVVPPDRVVRYDGDDPYLVVAADKGTATFSDLANSVAAEYGFWLGDAFASGGSAGYDHKKMGITARGAWESVRHHFQHLGRNPDEEPLTVVGIGDMSGDVFGNGMLMSRHIRLVGAFNHMHVFIDPDPDPVRSYEERRRLFQAPGSTWADYDPRLISRGGGVWPRTAKSIPLSPEARQLLQTEATSASPAEIIRLLLAAPVDLLWNGGIGTWVKADHEPHAAAGDRTNDAVRIDATRLRCRVIAEGGNLGLTQQARMQFAAAGGLVNADWIDNSGGVDCSDREVNIKILLNEEVRAGRLSMTERNRLLRAMTADVAQAVLQDNYRQVRAITAAAEESRRRMGWYVALLNELDRSEEFSREQERLPDNATLEKRRATQQGLLRPELAVILAHTKTAVFREIMRSDLPDDPYMQSLLTRYFPPLLRQRFAGRLADHQLRREIIATVVTNSMVNRAGVTFAHRLADETGASLPEVTRVYLMARDVFDINRHWQEIDRLDFAVPVNGQLLLVFELQHLLRQAVRWFLRHGRYGGGVGATVERFAAAVRALEPRFGEEVTREEWQFVRDLAKSMRAAGVPPRLASRFAAMRITVAALEIASLSESSGRPLDRIADLFFEVSRRVRIPAAHRYANTLVSDNIWQDRARTGLMQELLALQGALTADALAFERPRMGAAAVVEAWAAGRTVELARYEEVLDELQYAEQVDLAMISVLVGKLYNLRAA